MTTVQTVPGKACGVSWTGDPGFRKMGAMCGRFAADLDYSVLAEHYGARQAPGLPKPSWNISPGSVIALVAQDRQGHRHLHPARWNLIPSWSNSDRMAYPTHNARAESALTKRTYADSARSRRAIIPASGYYEWTRDHQPYYFQAPESPALNIAGLYSWWRSGPGQPWLLTATILTIEATPEAARVHDRMPLLITEADLDSWLDPGVEGRLILPRVRQNGRQACQGLVMHPVAPLKGDGPQLTEDIVLDTRMKPSFQAASLDVGSTDDALWESGAARPGGNTMPGKEPRQPTVMGKSPATSRSTPA